MLIKTKGKVIIVIMAVMDKTLGQHMMRHCERVTQGSDEFMDFTSFYL